MTPTTSTSHCKMPVATSSSGRALYDHASAAFVHNMPLEALSTAYNAIQSGQARATPLLAEQFCVLHITALCAVYTPNNPAEALEARLQQLRQKSGAGRGGSNGGEAQWPRALTELLSLAPSLFFSRLWWQTLQFYHGAPMLPSVAASTSDLGGGPAEAIAPPTPDVLPAALQLPGAVLEALVLGALKIDEDLARHGGGGGAKKKTKSSDKDAPPPGLQAARAMCEWVLSAYSTPAVATILSDEDYNDDDDADARALERRHLHDQYGRVLRLYALEVLGVRLQEWEYGSEIVRCAKLITGDADEVHARTALLAELSEAHSQADTRDDRHQAAKDKARRILQEQVEKRKMQASTGDLASSMASLSESKVQSTEQARTSTSLQTQSNGQTIAGAALNGKRSRPTLPERASSSSSANSGGVGGGNNGGGGVAASRRKASSTTPSSSGAGHILPPAWSLSSIRTMLQAWLRQLSGGPAVVLTLIAFALTVRRVLNGVMSSQRRSGAKPAVAPPQRLSVRPTTLQRQQPQAGLLGTAWHKLLATVRMGTQVTYL